ncbi:retinitis pigmentosa 1-like 1 protein [Varanus komodoensis]|uniref:retinitis pigmentosa 1-like 1 protein n=1 Tax=Varanus komodoensis TaxID=61221 RepID=UPI001CF7A3A9|nr:retinitis pigmentosa 1-like 1 protein [Varanus komodoensis]
MDGILRGKTAEPLQQPGMPAEGPPAHLEPSPSAPHSLEDQQEVGDLCLPRHSPSYLYVVVRMTQPAGDRLSTANPYSYEQPLPPVARANAVTEVPPAKKITFYKSGDPQFGGVKMAINQRSFKSFNALMDDLSHRVPLPFGVRTITTPRGIHCISTLDQLEDGGCYLCSDKKYVMPISLGAASGRLGLQKTGQPARALRKVAQEVRPEEHSAAFAQPSPRIPKKITLLKNGDIATQRPITLNRRNARSLKALLDEISEIMQFTVKKLYTVEGKRVDSLQALLRSPNVLVCVGREPFKPILTENSRKHSLEKLPGLRSRSSSNSMGENHEVNLGLKTKKSVIHPRSSLSNRSMRLSLSSEKSYPNGLMASPENGAPCLDNCPRSKAGTLVRSIVNDDIEKRVHVNKDGSLSVEMKVRFRLLNDETLQWSTQIKKSSLMNKVPCEEMGIGEENGVEPVERMNPEAGSEADSSYPCDADSYVSNLEESEIEEACCQNCGKPRRAYDIWKNPMHASQKEEPGTRSSFHTHSSSSSSSSHRRTVHQRVASVDSIRTSSTGEEYTKQVVRECSHYSETVEKRVEYHSVNRCCCRHDSAQGEPSPRGTPEEVDMVACLASSPNDGDSMVGGDGDGGRGSQAGSSRSTSSRGSAESQIKVCEETSSVARTISSRSVKEREDVEDVDCASSPSSVCSRSSKCSTPGGKVNPDEGSEEDQVISSFSSDSCQKKEAAEEEAEKEEEDVNEACSTSEDMASNQSAKEDVSECRRCSTEGSSRSRVSGRSHRQGDREELHECRAASACSRASRRSRRSQNHLQAASNGSARSSRESLTKRKKAKSSLHAEDARSNSRASCYSRSSYEVEKRDVEAPASSSPQSCVSSLSEDAAPPAVLNEESTSSTSKCYSRSSKGSQKEGQPEDPSETSAPCVSLSEDDGGSGAGAAHPSSQEHSSRPGSFSESTCSKCGHRAGTSIKDPSADSRVSSCSEVKSRCAAVEASGRSSNGCSQSSMAWASKQKASGPQANKESSSHTSAAESASLYGLHCPAPPKGKPSGRKSRTAVLKQKNSNSLRTCAGAEAAAEEEQKEKASSRSPGSDAANGAGTSSVPLNEEEGSCQEKGQEETEARAETAPEGGREIVPSSLPSTSPEEVVHEWLRKIPSETLLMECEMQDDGEEAGADAEMPSCSTNQELLEGGADEKDEAGSAAAAEISHKKDLPDTIQTSVQIMKALLAAKQEAKLDRSHSLPEVSPTMGRKLSNSANMLITCLASLQLLDEQLDPAKKSHPSLNRLRYTELLNIFQALWFGCASEKGGPSSGLPGEGQAKVPSGFKGHNSKDDDFTPMSSSGVDVSSGDGGSGDGSVAGACDCALSPEKAEVAKPTEGEEATAEGVDNEEEREEHSELPGPCSESEGGERAESAGEDEAPEVAEDQGSACEPEEEEEREAAGEEETGEEDKQEEEDVECAEAVADAEEAQEDPSAEDSPCPGTADDATDTKPEADPDGNEGDREEEPDLNAAQEPEGKSDIESGPSSAAPRQAAVVPQRSVDPDPVWVLSLLKKIEKEFMAHYVSAMDEFKVKWNLPNSKEVDTMIAELKEEVRKRIQKSVEKELRKIRSRAGRRVPRPPAGELQRDSTLQVGSRRRRLQSIHKMSLYNWTMNHSKAETRDLSGDLEEDLFFSTIRDDADEPPNRDEYCPCDACVRKKLAAKAARSTVTVVSSAPVVKAFDLQQILRMKRGDAPAGGAQRDITEEGLEEEADPAAEEAGESAADQEVGPEEGAGEAQEQEEHEGDTAVPSQREEVSENGNSTDGACEEVEGEAEGEEGEAAEEEGKEDDVDTHEDHEVEEENPASGGEEAEHDADPEAEGEVSSERADGEEEGGNDEGAEAAGEEEEAEGEDSPGPVQDSVEQEDPAATEDGARGDAEALRKGSGFSSMGNCSQQSQKGSEDGSDGEDCKEEQNTHGDDDSTNDGVDSESKNQAESRPAQMYPDSEQEEEEEEEDEENELAPSQAGAVKGGEAKTAENEKKLDPEAIDQDDLDF